MTLLVSYYTAGTGYQREAEGLHDSCERHGVEHRIKEVPNLGSWMKNTQYKPTFLLEVLEELQKPILWVDADARVQQPFEIPFAEDDYDFAAHWRAGKELLSGTLWFNYTEPAIMLLRLWKERCGHGRQTLDQRILSECVPEIPSLRIYRLPPEYTFIFDIMRRALPNVKPIIEHFQASRKYRRTING